MEESNLRFNQKLSGFELIHQIHLSVVKFRPELDTFSECADNQTDYFQDLIGIFLWIV